MLAGENTIYTEFEGLRGLKLSTIKLHQDRVIGGATRFCKGNDILLDEIVLELMLQRPVLTLLLGGANELGLEGLVVSQLHLESLTIVRAITRFNEIEKSPTAVIEIRGHTNELYI